MWMLDAGCWMLDAGCWMLVAGCWLLVAGCWLLVAGCCFRSEVIPEDPECGEGERGTSCAARMARSADGVEEVPRLRLGMTTAVAVGCRRLVPTRLQRWG